MNDITKYPFKIGQKVELLSTGSAVGGDEWVDKARKGDIVIITGIATYGGNATVNDPRYYGVNFNVRGEDLQAIKEAVNDKFKPGDIVNIINLGKCYTTYSSAFEWFGFKDLAKNFTKGVTNNDRYWTVVKTGGSDYEGLVMIESEGTELLINQKGLELADAKSYQEYLLDEAKNRYPVGTKVMCLIDKCIRTVQEQYNDQNSKNEIKFSGSGSYSYLGIYINDKWAEIVEDDNVLSTEAFEFVKSKIPLNTKIRLNETIEFFGSQSLSLEFKNDYKLFHSNTWTNLYNCDCETHLDWKTLASFIKEGKYQITGTTNPETKQKPTSEWIYDGDISLLEQYSDGEYSKYGELCVAAIDDPSCFRKGDIIELIQNNSRIPYILIKRTGKKSAVDINKLRKLPTLKIPTKQTAVDILCEAVKSFPIKEDCIYKDFLWELESLPTNSPSKHNDIQIPNEPVEIFIKKKK